MKILLLLLLIPLSAFSQQRPYYLSEGLNNFSNGPLVKAYNNTVYVTFFSLDSLQISPDSIDNLDATTYSRVKGEPFLRSRTKRFEPTFAFAGSKAILLLEENGSFLWFLADQKIANKHLSDITSNNYQRRIHFKDSLVAIVKVINDKIRSEEIKAKAENERLNNIRFKKVLNTYMKTLKSKRSDPNLERDIMKWNKNSNTKIYFLDENYTKFSNNLGELTHKSIHAIIKWNYNGKCFICWEAFGYDVEHGSYSKDLSVYSTTYEVKATVANDSYTLEEGTTYEIDCY